MRANDPTRSSRRALLIILFAVYLGLMVWAVLWKMHEPFIGRDDMREIKLIPFAPSGVYGASSPIELVGNLLIFAPLGVYLGLLAPRWRIGRVVAIAAATSVVLEVVQYVTAVGSSDVTDVIMNTAGALLGIVLLQLVRRRLRDRTLAVVTWLCLGATLVGLLAATLFVISLPRLPPLTGGTTGTTIIGGLAH